MDAAQGKWILYIDADERVAEFDRITVEALLGDASYVCHTLLFRPAVRYTRYREFRLFRTRADLRFESVIHETLVPALKALQLRKGLKVGESPVAHDHFGYQGDLHHKHVRNAPLLRARLEREPRHVYCLDQLGSLSRASATRLERRTHGAARSPWSANPGRPTWPTACRSSTSPTCCWIRSATHLRCWSKLPTAPAEPLAHLLYARHLVEHGRHADADAEFADACLQLLADSELAARLSASARQLVATRYSRAIGVQIIREMVAQHFGV